MHRYHSTHHASTIFVYISSQCSQLICVMYGAFELLLTEIFSGVGSSVRSQAVASAAVTTVVNEKNLPPETYEVLIACQIVFIVFAS